MGTNYVSNLGYTIGPLQIEKSGTWLTHSTEEEAIQVVVNNNFYNATILPTTNDVNENIITETRNIRYLAISHLKNVDSNDVQLAPLMAGHPLCGVYPSGDGYKSFCDINAVATVGWVMSYASLAPGDRALALDDLIYRTEFNELYNQVTQNTSNIGILQNNIEALQNDVAALQEATEDIDKMYWTKNVEAEGIIFIGWAQGSLPSADWS